MSRRNIIALIAAVSAVALLLYGLGNYARLSTPDSVAWWTDYALWCGAPLALSAVAWIFAVIIIADRPEAGDSSGVTTDTSRPQEDAGARHFMVTTDEVSIAITVRGSAAKDIAGLDKLGAVAQHYGGSGGMDRPQDSKSNDKPIADPKRE